MSSRSNILSSLRRNPFAGVTGLVNQNLKVMTSSFLLTLPLEVLTEILVCLDWTSILQVRQTCSFFRAVFQQHSILTTLVTTYTKSLFDAPRLDAPYYMYTAEALEKYLLRRLSLKKAWESLTPAVRTADCDVNLHLFRLLPGGRWLLTAQRSGQVAIYDLDSPGVAGTIIIPADPVLVELRLMSTEIDRKSEYLSFRLVLCPDLQQAVSVPIYEVSLSSFPTISWTCYELRRVTATMTGVPTSISIKGGIVAIGIRKTVNQVFTKDFVHLFNWQAWNPPVTPQVFIPVDVHWGPLIRVNLLSESKIIIFTQEVIALHDIPPIDGGDGVTQRPVWNVATPFKMDGEGISQPFICKDNMHFTLRVGSSVYGFVISEIDTTPGTLLNLFMFPFLRYEDIMCLGHHRAFARTSDLDVVTIDFNCDGVVTAKAIARRGTKVSWCPLETCMDEESGRVVVCMRGKLTIYDFTYPQYL
ncbi:hypothetical protein BDN72DRAFT_882644 [Pluteus cervinus]|uniref:Uncharacterized protein n=1 Tax=Pluteus cervinus TaxID=181527 RepID=A0ACD3A9A9_9AGAR|nr:hypothetical protein BDN72DRAFT_882644 [Pluteus cervinus]